MDFFRKIILLLTLSLALVPPVATAAVISLDIEDRELGVGSQLEVAVKLDTEGEEINAFEGTVIIPSELVQVKEIRDGNSIVNFWIERPRLESPQRIVFSGITAGGYRGESGTIFSVILVAEGSGSIPVSMEDIKLLKNDGSGTPAEISFSNLTLSVPPVGYPSREWEVEDRDAPELFAPEIAREGSLFDGQWFLVFATQDKKSGIDYYEVREGRWGKSIRAESPYVLQNQKLDGRIFVKAVDKAGNERSVTLDPPDYKPWYQHFWIVFILIVGIVAISLISGKKTWRKPSEPH